MGEEKALRNRL